MTVKERSKEGQRLSYEAQKSVSLYLIFFGLLLVVVVAASWGAWGIWFAPLSAHWFVSGIVICGAGCLGLMVSDACRLLRNVRARFGRLSSKRGMK